MVWIFMKWNLMNEEGFTLLEALIALMLSSLIILSLSAGLRQLKASWEVLMNDSEQANQQSELVRSDRQIEWHLFLNQLEHHLEGTINPSIFRDNFRVDEWDEQEDRYVNVRYERRGAIENFTRSKNNGNNRMLTGIDTIQFEQEDGWLLLNVQFKTGDKYLGRIWVNSWIKEEEESEKELESSPDNLTIDKLED